MADFLRNVPPPEVSSPTRSTTSVPDKTRKTSGRLFGLGRLGQRDAAGGGEEQRTPTLAPPSQMTGLQKVVTPSGFVPGFMLTLNRSSADRLSCDAHPTGRRFTSLSHALLLAGRPSMRPPNETFRTITRPKPPPHPRLPLQSRRPREDHPSCPSCGPSPRTSATWAAARDTGSRPPPMSDARMTSRPGRAVRPGRARLPRCRPRRR
jgi:hypothetical protein